MLGCPKLVSASVLDANMIDLLGKITNFGVQVVFIASVGPQKTLALVKNVGTYTI
jgi:hypothetical protein